MNLTSGAGATAAAKKSSSTVFVGNIPYGTTEDQLRDVFSQAGRVVNFRILYDKETGKPKGFGFCEYDDVETAMSAIRNLNNVEVNGRQLRVDFTENEKREMAAGTGAGAATGAAALGQTPQQQQLQAQQTGAPGQQPRAPGTNMKELSLNQIFELMLQLKAMLQQNPDQLRSLLLSNPPLAHAVVMGQIMLGIMPASVANASNAATSIAIQGGGARPLGSMPGLSAMQQQQPPPPLLQQQQQQQQRPPGMAHMPPQPGTLGMNAPPRMGIPPPPVPPPPGMLRMGPGGGPPGASAEQAALLQQVMNLTPQQIDALPPDQRAQVLQMQATMKAQIAAQQQQQQFRRQY